MSGTSPDRRLRRTLLPLLAFTMVAGLLSGGPAVAHTFTKSDGNDSKGRLDLRSVTVSHSPTGAIVYRFVTFERWKPKMLGPDSFLLVQIDWNHDKMYERCAFIFFGGGKLRGSLSNCGRKFVQGLTVSKPSGKVAKITIPKSQLGADYWWAGASVWTGPAPCVNGCLDFAPNNFPDILHDLAPPVITLDPSPLRIWEGSTSATFQFPFEVTDSHGVNSWKVESTPLGETAWSFTGAQGMGGGNKHPSIEDFAAGQYAFRVVATDNQANTARKSRKVYIPIDDTEAPVSNEFSVLPPVSTVDATAFGGSYSLMAATTVLTHVWDPAQGCLFELVGPGSDSGLVWQITVTPNNGTPSTFDQTTAPSGSRQIVYSDDSCSDTYTVTVNSGAFGLDAVLG